VGAGGSYGAGGTNYAKDTGINRHGDNGWQRSLNGYIHGDFGAGAICNVGDTCNVSNTFTGSGKGTMSSITGGQGEVISGNKGTWGAGSNSVGNASSNSDAVGKSK